MQVAFYPYKYKKIDFVLALMVFIASFGLYIVTMVPSVAAGDHGELATTTYDMGSPHPPGYPLFAILGKFFMFIPVGNIAYRMNLMSAFFGAATVTMFFLFVLKLLGLNEEGAFYESTQEWSVSFNIQGIAVITALMFSASNCLWSQAVEGEVYTLNSFLNSIMMLSALVWYEELLYYHYNTKEAHIASRFLVLVFFLMGLALTHHHTSLGYIVPISLLIIISILYTVFTKVEEKNERNELILYFSLFALSLLIAGLLFIYAAVLEKTTTKLVGDRIITIKKRYLDETDAILATLSLLVPVIFTGLYYLVAHLRSKSGSLNPQKSTVYEVAKTFFWATFFFILPIFVLYPYLWIRTIAIYKMPEAEIRVLTWGEIKSLDVLWNHILRKQYPFGSPIVHMWFPQMMWWGKELIKQFHWINLLFALPGIIMLFRKDETWGSFSIFTFLFFNLGFMWFVNPPPTPRDMSFPAVMLILSYYIVGSWIALGMQGIYNMVSKLLKNEKTKSILQTSTIIVFFLLSLIPLLINMRDNDNSKNWLNHDYGIDLLSTTELNSVLMTEGGDNQVFSLAYFQMVEYLRPDSVTYDQKGNVFKRIYGDLRYITADMLEKRMDTVDSNILAGNEPFYTGPQGTRGEPNFIPYPEGRRPVYMTWTGKSIWKFGDYYYKNYGILYKVQDVEYYIVDVLKYRQKISVNELRELISKILRKDVSLDFVKQKVRLVENKGYVKLEKDMVYFVKDYPKPHNGVDYWSKYRMRWREIPNVKYYDYLTREIVVNYLFLKANNLLEEEQNLKMLLESERDPVVRKNIEEEIGKKWEEARELLLEAVDIGFDMAAVNHNAAVVFTRRGDYDTAIKLYERAIEVDPFSILTYKSIISLLDMKYRMLSASGNEEEANKYLEKIKYYASKGLDVMKYYASVAKVGLDPQKLYQVDQGIAQDVGIFLFKKQQAEERQKVSFKLVMDLLNKLRTEKDINAYIQLLDIEMKRVDDEVLNELLRDDLVNYMLKEASRNQQEMYILVNALLRVLQAFNLYSRAIIVLEESFNYTKDPIFLYYAGIYAYRIGSMSKAKEYLEKFVDLAKNNPMYQNFVNDAVRLIYMVR